MRLAGLSIVVVLAGCGGSDPEWIHLAGSERVTLGDYSTRGFRIPGGGSRDYGVVAPDAAVLRVGVSCIASGDDPAEPGNLTISVDGELRAGAALVPGAPAVRLVVPLDAGERTVRFETTGVALTVAVHAPVVGPTDPPDAARPDVVVLLADTFRADNMAVYGGERDLTPNLDAFAHSARVYERSWAPSCWTLPSHSSLFLGVQPHQHGAVEHGRVASADLPSVVEELAATGYRTVGITDALYVSRAFGMDRGFEWFEEHTGGTLAATTQAVEEALASDDGRPLFLFVQTYRTHEPYRVTDETRAAHGERLGIEMGWDELRDAFAVDVKERVEAGDPAAVAAFESGDYLSALRRLMDDLGKQGPDSPWVRRLRALYHGGVIDLDRWFAAFDRQLAAHGIGDDAYLFFTSDHGEAFAEHGSLFHGHGPWEEVLRVPLVVRGPRFAQGRSSRGATLVDLARTLAELAGVAAPPSWEGRSLASDDADGPVFAFDCAQTEDDVAVIVVGDRKTVLPATEAGLADREVLSAWDLGVDPGERTDLAGGLAADWEGSLERLCGEAARMLVELEGTTRADLTDAAQSALRQGGYAGSDD